MTVRVRDKGANELLTTLNRARRGEPWSVEVGVIGNKASREKGEGVTVADVATWAELGLGQPKRSWLRGFIDEAEKKIQKRISKEMRAVVSGDRSPRQAMRRIGVWLVGEIQERISNKIPPPNAPSTVKAKGSSVPLIDTGQLRSSISSRVKNV